ncbi:alpha-amylase family glycosyl hydrolase [Spirochaeta dissipatitropha]
MRKKTGAIALLFAVLLLSGCGNPLRPDQYGSAPDSVLQSERTAGTLVQDLPVIPEHMVNETMFQFFYWNSYPGLFADIADDNSSMRAMAEDLAASGITAAWLPPAAKAMEATSGVGYSVYDFWDLGEFEQKGARETRYGTREDLDDALSVFLDLGVKTYFDVVFNHRMGADANEWVQRNSGDWIITPTYYDFAGRDAHYTPQRWGQLFHDFSWNWQAFNGTDYYGESEDTIRVHRHANGGPDPVLFDGKLWPQTYGTAYLMGNDVDYWYRPDGETFVIRDEMKAWGEWIINDVGFNGFRMDAIAHVDSGFTAEWINHVQANTNEDIFFVGEAWVGDVGGYLDSVNTPYLRAFDFSLRNDFVQLSSGNKDMRFWGGIVNSQHADRAVTFVDNHDTSRDGNDYNQPQVERFKNQAYAYMLMREQGVPTVFARDWDEFNMSHTLRRLVEARRFFAYGAGHENSSNTSEVYTYVREGLSDVAGTGLVLLVSGRDWGGQESFWINSRQPNTEFYDYTSNVSGTVTSNAQGYANFPVRMTESEGWSVWVPVSDQILPPPTGWEQAYFRGTPNDWGTSTMDRIENGIWEITADFRGQSNPRFKIDRYGDWTENYPEQDFMIDQAGEYRITFHEDGHYIDAVLIGDNGGGEDQITLRMTVDVGEGNSVFFTGSADELSNWGTGIEGIWSSGNVWELTINDPGAFDWKTRIGPSGGSGQGWETGGNHSHHNLHPAHQGW